VSGAKLAVLDAEMSWGIVGKHVKNDEITS
jgi:hypothetical protein